MNAAIQRIALCCSIALGIVPIVSAQTGGQSLGNYSYDESGNVISIGPDDTGLTNVYDYDSAGRLIQFVRKNTTTGAISSSETYEYDGYGNLTKQTTNGVATSLNADASTNRLTGSAYDAAGNMLQNGNESYTFDPAGTLTTKSVSGGTAFYIYTAGDERIGIEGPDHTWRYTSRDLDGKVLREWAASSWNGNWTWIEDYVYRDGQLAAAERPTLQGGIRHFHLDHLGSPRLITGADASTYAEHAYYPFGGEITSPTQEIALGHDTPEPMKFTGHERDFAGSYTGPVLDYMHARYYDPNMGRFLSVDPVIPVSSARFPQRWNRYAYVMNNPVNRTDPTGRDIVLSGCVSDAKSSACRDQLAAAQAAFGRAWSSVNYSNGVITLKNGVSPAGLGNAYGPAAHALGFMANSKDDFTVIADAGKAAAGNGVFTDPVAGGGANIYYDPGKLGGNRTVSMGAVNIGLAEALAHESGHGIEPYFASAQAINARYGAVPNTQHEAFAMFVENAWRRMEAGKASNDIRMYIFSPGDVNYEGTKLESIWP